MKVKYLIGCALSAALILFNSCQNPDDPPETPPAPPAEIIQTGSSGFLLRGVVLTPGGVLDPGEVLVIGDTITYIGTDASSEPGAADATWIETNGIISPGLIDCHNHIAYNFLPEFEIDPGTPYDNRYQLNNDPAFDEHLEPYAAHSSASSHFSPAADYAEIRCLLHGTTTVIGHPSGQSNSVDWGVRNATRYHGLGYDHMTTFFSSVREIDTSSATQYIDNMNAATEPVTRLVVHMAEGVSGDNIDEEFASFIGNDLRGGDYHQEVSLLHNNGAVLINCIALTDPELQEVADTGSKIVWSPSSNIATYGATTDIERILQLGITTGIGPDATIQGEDNLLAELRYAYAYGQQESISALTAQKLWEMATSEGAVVTGLDSFIGSLEAGKRADIVVFTPFGDDPYLDVINNGAGDVRLVLIDGEGYYGDAALDACARNAYAETLTVCGASKFLCVKDSSLDDGLAETETALYNILEGIGYPVEEQYGRGDELLPLSVCQ